MSKTIISEGKTTQEAIEKGLKQLNQKKENVNIITIEETEKRSFYNILSPRVVKVEISLKEGIKESVESLQEDANKDIKRKIEKEYSPKDKMAKHEKKERHYSQNHEKINQAKESIEAFLREFLKNKEDIQYIVKVEDFEIYIDIQGQNINYLIGYRGETINAMQTIVSAIANKNSDEKIKVYLDIAGYKEKRIKTLEELAEKLAASVIRNQKVITLEPMTAYERKIIHTKLQNHDKVKTSSKGDEPYRKVVISLK